jgi:hypothetical protein
MSGFTITFSSLSDIGELVVQKIDQLQMPSMQTVYGNITLADGATDSFNAPKLTTVEGSLNLQNMSLMTTALPVLENVTGNLNIQGPFTAYVPALDNGLQDLTITDWICQVS